MLYSKPKVKFFYLAVFTTALCVAVFPRSAKGLMLKNYTLDGRVTYSETSLMPEGSLFTGSFSIDFDAPLVNSVDAFSVYDGLFDLNFTMNGFDFQADSPGSVYVYDSKISFVDFYGPFLGTAADCTLEFSSPVPFVDHSLANAYDLDQWNSSGFLGIAVFGLDGEYQREIYGTCNTTSPSPVPEPGALVLMAFGLVIIFVTPRHYLKINPGRRFL
jgi:hypothetical protein